MDYESQFSPDDVGLLLAVLSANDSMLGAAHAVKLIEDTISYPVQSVHELWAVFERFGQGDGSIRVGPAKVTFDQVIRYFPQGGSPIDNRDQLISRLIVAFETERLVVLDSIACGQSKRALGRRPREG